MQREVSQVRGVTIPGLESESDFHHFCGINDSDSNSDSSKNLFSYCTGIDSGIGINSGIGIDSKMDSIAIPIPIPIPEKNGIVTPLSQVLHKCSLSVSGRKEGRHFDKMALIWFFLFL